MHRLALRQARWRIFAVEGSSLTGRASAGAALVVVSLGLLMSACAAPAPAAPTQAPAPTNVAAVAPAPTSAPAQAAAPAAKLTSAPAAAAQPAAPAAAPAAAASALTCTTPFRVRYASRQADSDPLSVTWTLADRLGYFKANCIAFERVKVDAGETAVMAGQAEVSVSGPDVMVNLLNKQGSSLPIVAFHNTIPYPHFRLLVLPDSPIQSLKDLQGKTVNTLTNAFSGTSVLQGELKSLGIEANIVSLPLGPAVANALTKGDVVALNDVDTNQVMYEGLLKTKLRVVPMLPELAEASGSIQVARKDLLQSHRADFVNYLKAWNAGYLFVDHNTKAAAAIQVDTFPELISAGESRDAAIDRIQAMLAARQASAQIRKDPWAQPQLFGWLYDQSWQVWVRLNSDLPKDFDFHPALTNDIVKDSWDFDQAAVIKQAESYKS